MGKHAPRTGDESQAETAKVPKDKVKKSSKAKKSRHKKHRREQKLAAAIEEEIGGVDNGVEAEDQLETGESIQLDEKRETRNKKKKKLKGEPQQQTQEEVAKQALDPTPSTTHSVDEAQQKKEAKLKQKESTARNSNKTSGNMDEQPLFIIDTNPTKVDGKSSVSHSGLNRAARRQRFMIEQQKQRIARRMNREGQLEAGSDKFDQEVQRRLDAWTQERDQNAAGKKQEHRKNGLKRQNRKTRGRSRKQKKQAAR